MNCIFCKTDSTQSRSLEHIIPESLGNKEHILPPGIVCDACNNYFASKIEKKLLEQPYFMSLRFRQSIISKKGKYAEDEGFSLFPPGPLGIGRDLDGSVFIYPKNTTDISKFVNQKKWELIIPIIDMPEKDNIIIARFLGKIGIETIAKTLMNIKGGLEELVNKRELDSLRNYVRHGTPNFIWPYNIRRIYSEDKLSNSDDQKKYQIIHECRLLYTDRKELYIVLAIMGVEYSLNMDRPDLDGYKGWLRRNHDRSPLSDDYCGTIDISTIE